MLSHLLVQVQLHFRVVGVAVDVPVWVPKPDVDLKICMYDRLYQDSVLVHTRCARWGPGAAAAGAGGSGSGRGGPTPGRWL